MYYVCIIKMLQNYLASLSWLHPDKFLSINHGWFKSWCKLLTRSGLWNSSSEYECMAPSTRSFKSQLRRIYTTFILGTELQNFGTRTINIGHGPLDFCRVKALFSGRVPKNLGGPRPPQEVVSLRLKRGPCAANQKYSRPKSPCAHDWQRNQRLWDQK